MNLEDIKRIFTSFADNPSNVTFSKGSFFAEIRGKLIDVKISQDADQSYSITENDKKFKAIDWISSRLADLPELANKIIENVPVEQSFVEPTAKILEEISINPEEVEHNISDPSNKLISTFSTHIPGITQILYLASDAGEGKTTLINHIANIQAKKFKKGEVSWLLIPISLAGKPFLSFDDIVIASLVNKLRFRSFYYESFIELIKLGLVVPAFDGFEEMFMVGSSGEALSATGNLVSKLNSSGSILFATRKAYFDNKGFNTQAKLFDTITNSISFAKITLNRWSKEQFEEYAIHRGVDNAGSIYDTVNNKLGNPTPPHPILTRAVLVKQLLALFSSPDDFNSLIEKLSSPATYFNEFVHAIIERESSQKWIDRSGEPFKPLLSPEHHYKLLAHIADEMWVNCTDELHESLLDLISELYSESNKLNLTIAAQVKERVKQHALIISSNASKNTYKFDHEEFREYFLGYSIFEKFISNDYSSLETSLIKGKFPVTAIDIFVLKVNEHKLNISSTIQTLNNIVKNEGLISTKKENIGKIIIRLLGTNCLPEVVTLNSFIFPTDSLMAVNISNIVFENCYFEDTSLEDTHIKSCKFINCVFDRLEIERGKIAIADVEFDEKCKITCIYDIRNERSYYSPVQILSYLKNNLGIFNPEKQIDELQEDVELDNRLVILEKILRRFYRSNFLNENIFRVKLGQNADYFMKDILPDLIKWNIIDEVAYLGGGRQNRYKLKAKYSEIQAAFEKCDGDFNNFLSSFE